MAEKKKFEMNGINKKIAEEMQKIGFTHIEAKIMVYMFNNDIGISKAIEHETGLRQPEASVGLQKLRNIGLLKKEDIKLKGKGRPIHKYSLKKTMNETRDAIMSIAEQRVSVQKEHIASLNGYFDQLLKK
jgi:predicted transcriptional regulator